MADTNRPLIFVDVDGVLNPSGTLKPGYTGHRMKTDLWVNRHPHLSPDGVDPLRVHLNPCHGQWLTTLAAETDAELAWATMWEKEANTWISPILGLSDLPVVEFPDDPPPDPAVYEKTPRLVDYAAGRPFAWLDDQIEEADTEYVCRNHPERALMHHVQPRAGLTRDDIRIVADWLTSLEKKGE